MEGKEILKEVEERSKERCIGADRVRQLSGAWVGAVASCQCSYSHRVVSVVHSVPHHISFISSVAIHISFDPLPKPK